MLILFLNDMDIQLILEFKNSFGKNCPVFPKIPFLDKQFCKNLRACNFFAIQLRMLISFLNDADIKTISEFKESFGKYYPVFPKIKKKNKCKKCRFLTQILGEKV